jgi:hypothetical protein
LTPGRLSTHAQRGVEPAVVVPAVDAVVDVVRGRPVSAITGLGGGGVAAR